MRGLNLGQSCVSSGLLTFPGYHLVDGLVVGLRNICLDVEMIANVTERERIALLYGNAEWLYRLPGA